MMPSLQIVVGFEDNIQVGVTRTDFIIY